MDAAAVVESASVAEVQAAIHSSEASWKRPFFAEEYIDGREFNLALLGEGPFVLPPAEIDFSAYPTDKPRIVCYRAKCDTSSFEYHHTPRRFDFPPSDRQMLNRLLALSRECWRMFGLRGYARIDFRCDAGQQPWILEINTNPCLLPEAGFAAAFSQAGISYEAGIQRILDDAVARGFSVGRARDYPKSMLKVTAGHEIST
jgi:D-alanine-D-alanine ligase